MGRFFPNRSVIRYVLLLWPGLLNTSLEISAKTPLIQYVCIYIQSILIIQGFHICEFTDLLKFIYKCVISTRGTLPVIHKYVRSGGKFESINMEIPKGG